MRKKDREVIDENKIDEIIRMADCCRIGFYDKEEDEVYIVPLNFGYSNTKLKKVFYFHGAKEGRKIDLIKKINKVSFEIDTNHKLIESDIACKFSERFSSVMGTGQISFINDNSEKIIALKEIMFQNTGKRDWEFKENMLESVAVFKIEVSTISCKVHL